MQHCQVLTMMQKQHAMGFNSNVSSTALNTNLIITEYIRGLTRSQLHALLSRFSEDSEGEEN
jgi:hypothetical protein